VFLKPFHFRNFRVNFRVCPNDVNEAVSSLIFASARCVDIPKLRAVWKLFGQHYGQRFEKTALELY
jgi:vacuolar protein sorting-associated protein IST1